VYPAPLFLLSVEKKRGHLSFRTLLRAAGRPLPWFPFFRGGPRLAWGRGAAGGIPLEYLQGKKAANKEGRWTSTMVRWAGANEQEKKKERPFFLLLEQRGRKRLRRELFRLCGRGSTA